MAKHGSDQNWREHVMNNVLPRMESTGPAATGLEPGPVIEAAAPMPIGAAVHTAPSFDPIDRLPEDRKDLLRKIRQHSDDGHAIIPPGEDVRELSMRKIDAANELKRLVSHPQDWGKNLPPDHPSVVQAQRTLDKATDEFERLKQLQEVRTAAWQAAARAKTNCEDLLRFGVPGNCTLEAVEIEPPKLLKGESLMDGILRLQRRGREVNARSAPSRAVASRRLTASSACAKWSSNWHSAEPLMSRCSWSMIAT